MTATMERRQETLPGLMTREEAAACVADIRRTTANLRERLVELEARQGYLALGHRTMRACAEAEFGWSWRQFYRQLSAAEVERQVGVSIGQMPESHARELARLPAAQRQDAYKAAGVGATAAEVRREVDRRRQPAQEAELLPQGESMLDTDAGEMPLCHGCGEPVPGAGEPALCPACAPHYGGPLRTKHPPWPTKARSLRRGARRTGRGAGRRRRHRN